LARKYLAIRSSLKAGAGASGLTGILCWSDMEVGICPEAFIDIEAAIEIKIRLARWLKE